MRNENMDEDTKLKNAILILVDEIDRICKKNNIIYTLDSGSFLGAIRHGGFIPWDDDFDIAMSRREYECFCMVCREELDSSRFFLQNEDTEYYYAFSFAKLQLVGTEIIEDFSKDVNIKHGIFVDIFPIDKCPPFGFKNWLFLLINRIIKNVLWVKCGYGSDKKKQSVRYYIYKFLGLPFSIEQIKKIRKKHIQKYNELPYENGFCSDYPNEKREIAWNSEVQFYNFEGRMLPGPKEYDAYLTTLYGDYMKLPPKEKRKKHSHLPVNYGPCESEITQN